LPHLPDNERSLEDETITDPERYERSLALHQRDWRHSVPKQSTPAGARISVNFAPFRA
jgi:hypothetical protein